MKPPDDKPLPILDYSTGENDTPRPFWCQRAALFGRITAAMMVPIAVGVFLVASGAICCSIFVLMIPGVLMLAWAEAVGEEAKWAITASLVLAIIVEIPAAIFTIMVIADTHSRRDLSGAFLVLLFGCAVFVIINAMFIFYLTLSSQAR